MSFFITAHTDIGRRTVNQDAFCVRTAKTPLGEVAMAVLCDGMGGADDGDRASEETISGFDCWFDEELPSLLKNGLIPEQLEESWRRLLTKKNSDLIQYGDENKRKLGTTASAVLANEGHCFFIHIGDSRIYRLSGQEIIQLSTDHSLVAEEVRKGILTPEMAKTDPRRNILTQCVGIRGGVYPEFCDLGYHRRVTFLLCSDGFVHENPEQEVWRLLNPRRARNERNMKKGLIALTEHAKTAGECDNISTVLLRIN